MARKATSTRKESNRDPRAIRSSEALEAALLKLLRKQPFDQITIRDIVAEAGVGYTTFFRHHATKEELLDALAAEQIRCLFNLSLPAADAADMAAGSTALFAYVNAHKSLWTALLTGGAAATVRAEFVRRARDVAAMRGDPDAWLPSDLGAQLLAGGTLDLVTWWLRQPKPLPIRRMVEIHEAVVINPVLQAHMQAKSREASG